MANKAESVLVTMPVGVGVDESAVAEVLDPNAGFLVLENLRQTKRGSLEKRRGFTPVSSGRLTSPGTSRSSCVRMFVNDGDVCTVDSAGKLDVYSTQAGAWAVAGQLPSCTVTRTPIASRAVTGYVPTADAIEVNGYRILVTASAGTVWGTVVDAGSGSLIYASTTLASLCIIHDALVAASLSGTRAHAIYARGTSVYRRTFDTASPAAGWGAETALFNTLSAQHSFDVVSLTSSWALALTSGVNQLTISTNDDPGTGGAATTFTSSAVLKVSLSGDQTDRVWVSNTVTGGVRVFGINPSTLALMTASAPVIATSFTPLCVASMWTASGRGVAMCTDASGSTFVREFYDVAGTTTVVGAVTPIYGIQYTFVASRPWLTSAWRWHVLLTPYDLDASPNKQKTTLVCDVTDIPSDYNALPRVVATIAPRIEMHNSEDIATIMRQPCHVVKSGTRVTFPAVILRSSTGSSIEMVDLNYSDADAFSSVDLHGTAQIGAGATSQFDGIELSEANFFVRPQIISVNATAVGGGITCTTGYSYVVVFEWTDARGNVHRSAPSDPIKTATFASASKVLVRVKPLYLTNRQAAIYNLTLLFADVSVTIAIYRTSDGGVTYYRVASMGNVTTLQYVEYQDQLTDANLAKNAQLYNQPGLLGTTQPHAHPPGLKHLTLHRDRIIGVGDDGYTLWPSAAFVYGEGAWWGDVFQLPIVEGGAITALASQDGRLYVFKRDRIFVVDGDGPSENGAAGEFAQPYKLPTALGCISHRSVTVAPGGVFFQSTRGIEVLSRGGGVQWIGERVRLTLLTYPTVTSAVTREEEGRVYFTCTDAGGTSGVTLVFDYAVNDMGVWSIDKFYDSELASSTGPASHSVSIYGDYYRCTSSTGRVWREYTYSLDNSFYIPSVIETAWIKPAGMHGQTDFVRTILAGRLEDYCTVYVQWSYDYRDTAADAESWQADQVSAVNTDMGRVHLESFPDNNRKAMAAKLRIYDAAPQDASRYPLTTAKGVTWFGYTIEAQAHPDGVQLPETARG